MVIFLNLDGTATKVTPQHVYQGSNNVTEVSVVAPFPSTTAMQIGFILPNGLYWQSTDGARYAPMAFAYTDEKTQASVWTYSLPQSVTQAMGDVYIAINALTANGNTTSYLCKVQIEESVLPNLPSTPEPSVYELIQLYLAKLDGRTANVPNLVKSIQKVASNAFTFTNNSGLTSAPIVLDSGEAAPMPLGAASVVRVPSTGWTQSGDNYTVVIGAALHGQMRDGATADDLWVSFVSADGTDFDGVYQGFTVNEAGDITVTVTTPVAMTVRVWNGKGLVDVTAREEIAAETARAEEVESDLQEQIDHIVDTGVDKLAREQIAAETARAEAAEQTLQANINAEQSRAEAAELKLGNDIAENAFRIGELQMMDGDINERLDSVYSKIPNDASNDNLLTTESFVNSSINNMAAFYITSNEQGDAFPTHQSLLDATEYYYAGQLRNPTQNDYAIVLEDTSQLAGADGKFPTTRYSYQGTYPSGSWSFQYVVNNTSLTQAQVEAVNSGITKQKIASMDAATAAKYTKPTSGIPESDLSEAVQEKINTAAPVYSVNGKTGAVNLNAQDVGAMPTSGGQFTGRVSFKNAQAVDNMGALPYFLGMTAFANGGTVVYRTATEILNDLGAYSPNNKQPIYLHRVNITITGSASGNVFLWIYSSSPNSLNLTKFFNYLQTRNSTGPKTAYPARGYITGSTTMNVDGVYVSGTTPLGSAITLCNGQTELRLNTSVTYGGISDSVNDNTTI